jgi:cytoskeletal protein CcmA (bactofilin family)
MNGQPERSHGAEAASVERGGSGGTLCAIGVGARFEGLLSFWGEARVDGSLRGEIVARGTLEVGPEARIAARIEADAVVVAGTVEGEILARDRVEVLPGARVHATVRTPRLVVSEGAQFEGRLDMAQAGPDPGAASWGATA